ncbi:MAG: LTA synthase family protein [Ruminococcaceae bacterium]|nr:LTA synthase family protein [Oscillospiraceae bacterium]
MNDNKRSLSACGMVYPLILALLLFIKSKVFYSGLHLADFPSAFAMASAGILLLVYTAVSFFSTRGAKVTVTVMYFIVSVLLGVDGVYYSYVSKLPTVAQLGMVTQLDDISETIEGLIKAKDVMMLIDLPIWIILFVNNRLFGKQISEGILGKPALFLSRPLFKKWHTAAVSGAVALVLTLGVVLFPSFEAEYMANEIMCYHVSDIYTSIFMGTRDRVVDKSKYTSPDYSDYEFFGVAEGRNVIIIQVEALQNFVIGAYYEGQELTSNLNKLIHGDSFYFANYYYQIGGGNTADAEFHVNNSLFAPESNAAYMQYPDNTYYGLPYLLKDEGYSGAYAYHGYIGSFWNREYAYPNQGFDDYISLEDFEENDVFGMGLSDRQLFTQSMEMLKTYEEPFYAFYITLSSHYPYGIPLEERQITLKPEDEQTLFGLYIQSVNYADRCIGEFIEMLKEADMYDNTILVIYGDHYALGNTDSNNATRFRELTGRKYTLYDMFNVPLIINVPGMEHNETVNTAGGHIDVLPTLLYLLGITNDKAVMFGQNLIEAEVGFVCQQTHMSAGSFINNEVLFKKPHNNIKTNYDAYQYGTDEKLDYTLFEAESDYALGRIRDCQALLERNDVLLGSE